MILIACETSGVVRDAWRRAGYDAISCDILPTETHGPHIQGDVTELLAEPWDLVIAHPPCTYLALSGVRWLHERPERWKDMRRGAEFFAKMFEFNTPRLCVENPIQHRYAVTAHGQGRQNQVIHPWQHGHAETKRTGLWLRGLPPLTPSDDVHDVMSALPDAERHRIHRIPPGPERWKARSRTYPGIAAAMVAQWAHLVRT